MNKQIITWNPFKEMEQIQNRLATLWERDPFRLNGGDVFASKDWSPRVDIVEDEKEFVVKAELPEIKREDVTVSVAERVLTIAGERQQEKEEKNRKFHRIEREYGSFSRSFTLPADASGDEVTADFKDGILRVHLPKNAKPAGKAIEIKAA